MAIDGQGNLIYANPAAIPVIRAWDTEVGSLLPKYWIAHVKNVLRGDMAKAIEHGAAERVFLFDVLPAGDDLVYMYGYDITERKLAEHQLAHDAFHDRLTGLPNRALLVDRLTRAIERLQRRSDYKFSVILLDIDRFQIMSDSLGHELTDQLLIGFSHTLRRCLRAGDTAARLAGDQFVIVLDDIQHVDEAKDVVARVQMALKQPFSVANHQVYVTACMGVAHSVSGYTHAADLLRDADTAMHRAKGKGRAHAEVFEENMRDHSMARLSLENDLRRAIEREEFVVYYQPIIHLGTGGIEGFEALVRWEHPDRGLVSPGEFIPVAEDTELIVPIDRLVLLQACKQVRRWQEEHAADKPLTISVNLSRKHFSQPDLVDQIRGFLKEANLPGRSLKLEVTESVIMKNAAAATTLLSRLKELDIQLCVDDFGTGYSSLSYLNRFPVDTLKVDRSFVSHMESKQKEFEIVRTIMTLAHTLGMDVIAEGIETRGQLAALRNLRCEYGQGYYFSKPVPQAEATSLLLDDPRW